MTFMLSWSLIFTSYLAFDFEISCLSCMQSQIDIRRFNRSYFLSQFFTHDLWFLARPLNLLSLSFFYYVFWAADLFPGIFHKKTVVLLRNWTAKTRFCWEYFVLRKFLLVFYDLVARLWGVVLPVGLLFGKLLGIFVTILRNLLLRCGDHGRIGPKLEYRHDIFLSMALNSLMISRPIRSLSYFISRHDSSLVRNLGALLSLVVTSNLRNEVWVGRLRSRVWWMRQVGTKGRTYHAIHWTHTLGYHEVFCFF